jgi:hypothetical protein
LPGGRENTVPSGPRARGVHQETSVKKTKSCGYQGFEFGGGYLDAVCIDGWLWDLDSCDEPGGLLYNGGPDTGIACPKCNPDEYRRYFRCTKAEVNRRVKRAFGPTPWIPSDGPKTRTKTTK